jgi:hypothetical protein
VAKGKDTFTPQEAQQIRELLRRKIASSERKEEKDLRDELRSIPFYSSDFRSGGPPFTAEEFDDRIDSGEITIDGGATSRAGFVDQAEVDWLVELLREVAGEAGVRQRRIDPVGAELLSDGWTTIQRVALGRRGDRLALCAWPGELTPQAEALYSRDRVARLLDFLGDHREWKGIPRPHLAFAYAKTAERLYLTPSMDLATYLGRWTEPDARSEFGGHKPDTVRSRLWPWLLEQGFTDEGPEGDGSLDAYVERVDRRPEALLRPGLELSRHWDWTEAREARHEGLLGELRESLRELLEALDEPVLPRRPHDA